MTTAPSADTSLEDADDIVKAEEIAELKARKLRNHTQRKARRNLILLEALRKAQKTQIDRLQHEIERHRLNVVQLLSEDLTNTEAHEHN